VGERLILQPPVPARITCLKILYHRPKEGPNNCSASPGQRQLASRVAVERPGHRRSPARLRRVRWNGEGCQAGRLPEGAGLAHREGGSDV